MKFARGHYTPQNPQKYLGKRAPVYRSSWEFSFMQFCDSNPSILNWSSECVNIPYVNPLTHKKTHYVPDFIIRYIDKNNVEHVELIEIKPRSQTTLESAGRSTRNQAQVVVNHAKWQAAQAWANQCGIAFRIITEHELFHNPSKR